MRPHQHLQSALRSPEEVAAAAVAAESDYCFLPNLHKQKQMRNRLTIHKFWNSSTDAPCNRSNIWRDFGAAEDLFFKLSANLIGSVIDNFQFSPRHLSNHMCVTE
jgi:hypothetical protein